MQKQLWMSDRGWYAEYCDTLGLKQAHPSAALWSIYHTVDSEVPDPWQAWLLFKGTMFENMYRGICPGNAGMTLSYDPYRGECIPDFGDGIGSLSRTMIEGLFGVAPDALPGKVTIRPGWPKDWKEVSFKHPSLQYTFKRTGQKDRYVIEPKFGKPMRVKLIVEARGSSVKAQVNGKRAKVENVNDSIGQPRVAIDAEASKKTEIIFHWLGKSPSSISTSKVAAIEEELNVSTGRAKLQKVFDPQHALKKIKKSKHGFSAILNKSSGHHTVFARVQEGDWNWWMVVEFETRPLK